MIEKYNKCDAYKASVNNEEFKVTTYYNNKSTSIAQDLILDLINMTLQKQHFEKKTSYDTINMHKNFGSVVFEKGEDNETTER